MGENDSVQTLNLSGGNHLVCWWRLENSKRCHVVMRTVGGQLNSDPPHITFSCGSS